VAGLLTGVFIYWGWESAVNLTEEVEDSASAPGRAAVLSTVILVVTYVAVGTAVVAFAGLDRLAEFEDDDAIFSSLATDVLGSPWDQIVVLAVLTSALASTQTTILPASRTTLSMARAKAMPAALAHVHARYRTPHVSTWVIGGLATLWYVVANSLSENFLFDTLSALSLMIALYYALSGVACVVYYRRELTKSVKNFLFIGVAPAVGALILGYLLIRSVMDLSDPEASYSGTAVLGVGVPLVIGVAFLALGAIIMFAWWAAGHRGYFRRRPFEALPPDFVPGAAAGELAEVPAGER
jgi:amino acid transporter